MTRYQEESLLQMFERAQVPFETSTIGNTRQNMLSYSFFYVHKFLQIMNWDEYLPYFLLVSADKIQIQDGI